MDIIIFGGSGGIGSITTTHLKCQTNCHITNFSKHTPNSFADRNILACASDYKSVYNAISPGSTVIHLAGLRPSQHLTAPEKSALIDEKITRNIYRAALEKNAERLIFSSSGGSIYGKTHDRPISEDENAHPIHPYGISKLRQEIEICSSLARGNIFFCILRLANAYGFENNNGREDLFSKILLSPKFSQIPIFGDGSAKRDYIHATDIAIAIEYAIKFEGKQIFNIGTGIGTNTIDIVNLINETHNMYFRTSPIRNRKFNIPCNILNIDRAKKILNWEPSISLADGIKSLKMI